MTEPQPTDPRWPRYSTLPFPAYRFVPGQTPHPRRHPRGHSHGQPEPTPALFPPHLWRQSSEYLYGVDLYNFAFWWECHEVFEGLWKAAGRDTEQGDCFQALIQLAAANLKFFLARPEAARKLLRNGIARFRQVPPCYMGLDVAEMTNAIHRRLCNAQVQVPLIHLDMRSPWQT